MVIVMMGGRVICKVNFNVNDNVVIGFSSSSMLTIMATITIIMYPTSFIDFICVDIIDRKIVTHLCP